MKKEVKMSLFQGKKIRKTIYNKEWWFLIVDGFKLGKTGLKRGCEVLLFVKN